MHDLRLRVAAVFFFGTVGGLLSAHWTRASGSSYLGLLLILAAAFLAMEIRPRRAKSVSWPREKVPSVSDLAAFEPTVVDHADVTTLDGPTRPIPTKPIVVEAREEVEVNWDRGRL